MTDTTTTKVWGYPPYRVERLPMPITDTTVEGGDGSITFEHILTEELFEAYAETDLAKIRAEMVQCAAVAVQVVETIDRQAEHQ